MSVALGVAAGELFAAVEVTGGAEVVIGPLDLGHARAM
jgi:hypothetical protein